MCTAASYYTTGQPPWQVVVVGTTLRTNAAASRRQCLLVFIKTGTLINRKFACGMVMLLLNAALPVRHRLPFISKAGIRLFGKAGVVDGESC